VPVQSFRTLIAHLGTRCRTTCVAAADPTETPSYQMTQAHEVQAEALRLIAL
jgi:hypothetical protein